MNIHLLFRHKSRECIKIKRFNPFFQFHSYLIYHTETILADTVNISTQFFYVNALLLVSPFLWQI